MFNPKILIISTIFLIIFSGCTEKNTESNNRVLNVGACTDLAPTSYLEDGEFKGFEVELIYEISKRLDLKPEFIAYSFSELLDAVSEGNVDCGIGYIGRTPERQLKMDFSRQYAYTYSSILVKQNSECVGIKCLEHKSVGVLKDSIEEKWLESLSKSMDFDIISYENQNDIHKDLLSGKIDSEVTDHLTSLYLIQKYNSELKIVGDKFDIIYIAIAIDNTNPELKKSIDAALLEMENDGTLVKLKEKWNID
ncbi:polar amino acid transport system substrate-binding protein [Methanococcus maripaludis]|uniref:Polar amino acid transport system substrate-binding protein n=1 Tax=Methanococcus maripaludis TaxID=39152 RepID=A0A7J9SDV5_METMI|nr:ABC transporter substrate-binding protein [Methanococcus maripaludis]MBA2840915.1 polar amino acid transport system substrate-binding protein [Methanococcus maripaludis]MBA2868883.1 polar amino acid transport system substrate-binding protein [Methanococcus maripaludis]MBB6497329.1 polar amino acid transport system substrate-binding protein [Methanococcus maripaludis]